MSPSDSGQLICSARGCRAPARYALRWRNPTLHDAGRRKTWLACPDHRTTLADFLAVRGFLAEIELVDVEAGPPGPPGTHTS